MKKINLKTWMVLLLISLIINSVSAQGTFINLNVGYGTAASEQNLSSLNFNNYTRQNNFTTREQVNISFGKGLNIGGSIGYMFNENIGMELGISYLMGGKSEARDLYTNRTVDNTIYANMLRFNPSLIIAAGFKNINPYAKIGMLIGSGSILYESIDNNNGDLWVSKTKFNGGLAFGLNSAVGVLFSINENLSFFVELDMVNLSYAPTKSEITEASLNGSDQLPGMTTKERQTDFVDNYTTEQGNPSPDSQPDKLLIEKYPFGSVGLNIGLKINL
ncbi:MAG: outer membrane beta-barrel protein [Bacteroidales bacterium]